MFSGDLTYLRRRAAEERQRAIAALSPDVRALHLDLAKHYDRASGQLDNAEHMRSSREAVERSLRLLGQTAGQVPGRLPE